MKPYRLILNIPKTQGEIFMNRIAMGITIGIILYTIISFANLPESIPIHWNAKGVADSFGSKNWILFYPFISAVIYVGMTKFCEYPHKFNHISKITETNVEQEYIRGRSILRMMNVGCQIIFAIILFTTVRAASGGKQNLGQWFVPIVLISSVLPLIYAIFMSAKRG